MTPTARTVLPTDLVALVSYDGQVYANQAMTLERVGTQDSPHPLEAAFEQWFNFATGRHTWISVKGPTLRGLISARKRGSKQAWEIDCLINAEEQDGGVLMSLLDQVTDAAGRSGALRIFLRLPEGAPAHQDAVKCGFAPYRHEQVYWIEREASRAKRAMSPEVRRRVKADEYPLFQLYNRNVPDQIRRYEAMTLAEWTAAQETLGRTAHYVLEREGDVSGSLRLAGDGDVGRFELLAPPERTEQLLDAALAKLANRTHVHAVVPDWQEHVARTLSGRGFQPGAGFAVLTRRTVRPVREAKAVRAVVQTTFG